MNIYKQNQNPNTNKRISSEFLEENKIKVLNILKEKLGSGSDLPTKGLLAGGSIANIYWELVSGNSAVVNDIDIFEIEYLEDLEEKINSERISNIQNYNKNNKIIPKKYPVTYKIDNGFSFKYHNSLDYNGIVYTSNKKKLLSFLTSDRNGLINNTTYYSNIKEYDIIIESFDLNCVSIGIDLETKSLVYSDTFIEFLNTGEMKVRNPSSPFHSVIRLFKKMEETNSWFDQTNQLVLLSFVGHVTGRYNDKIRTVFAEKNKDLFIEYSNKYPILKKYFHEFKMDILNNQIDYPDYYDNLYSLKINPAVIDFNNNEFFNAPDKNLNSLLSYYYDIHNSDIWKYNLYMRFKSRYSMNNKFLENIDYEYVIFNKRYIDEIENISNKYNIQTIFGYNQNLIELVEFIKSIIDRTDYNPIILDILSVSNDEVLDIDMFKDDELTISNIKYRKELYNLRNGRIANFKYSGVGKGTVLTVSECYLF